MVVQSVCTLWTDLRGLAVCTSGADVPQWPRPLSSPPGVVADCPETERRGTHAHPCSSGGIPWESQVSSQLHSQQAVRGSLMQTESVTADGPVEYHHCYIIYLSLLNTTIVILSVSACWIPPLLYYLSQVEAAKSFVFPLICPYFPMSALALSGGGWFWRPIKACEVISMGDWFWQSLTDGGMQCWWAVYQPLGHVKLSAPVTGSDNHWLMEACSVGEQFISPLGMWSYQPQWMVLTAWQTFVVRGCPQKGPHTFKLPGLKSGLLACKHP